MKFRYARHTSDLSRIVQFYTELIGLKVLGSFNDHDGYNGVFLGNENQDWHLEFTVSKEEPNHLTDKDDLLVFYTEDIEQ